MPRFSALNLSCCYAAALMLSLPSAVHAQTLNVDSDLTIANNKPITGTYTQVNVGISANGQNLVPGVKADVVAGASISNLRTFSDNTTTTFYDGAITNLVTGGSASSTGTFTMLGGTVGSLETVGFDVVTVNGGTITGNVNHRVGTLIVNSGTITNFVAGDASFASATSITGGTFGSGTGGSGFGFLAAGRNITISGGTINDGLFSFLNGADPLRIRGGAVTNGLFLGDRVNRADTQVSGGAFREGIYNLSIGETTFFGANIALTNATAGSYDFRGSLYTGTYYTIRGAFENGQDATGTTFFVASRTNGTNGFNIVNTGISPSAPEPGSLALAAIGMLTLIGAVRRRKQT